MSGSLHNRRESREGAPVYANRAVHLLLQALHEQAHQTFVDRLEVLHRVELATSKESNAGKKARSLNERAKHKRFSVGLVLGDLIALRPRICNVPLVSHGRGTIGSEPIERREQRSLVMQVEVLCR